MRVTSFMLADAAQEVNGKLYIIGGGWNLITVPSGASPIRHRMLAVVAILSIEWHEANEPLTFEIDLVDADGRSVMPQTLKGELTVGRPPMLPKGAEQLVPLVVNVHDLTFDHLGTYAFVFRFGEGELARAPFHIIASGPPARVS